MSNNYGGWRKGKDKTYIDHQKLDNFIEVALSKFEFKEASSTLYKATGNHAYYIVNNNSLTPDLVIFNKVFNKNHCFHDFKGVVYNPYPRKRFKFDSKKVKEEDLKEHNSFGSNEEDPQWADFKVEDILQANHLFEKLPSNNFGTKEILKPYTEVIASEQPNLEDKNQNQQEIEKTKVISDKKNEDASNVISTVNINIFYNNYNNNEEFNKSGISSNLINNEPEAINNNDFDIQFLQQMSQNVYGMKYSKSQDNSIVDYSREDDYSDDKFKLKSLLEDDETVSQENSILKQIETQVLETVSDSVISQKEKESKIDESNRSSQNQTQNSINPQVYNPNLGMNMQFPLNMMPFAFNPYLRAPSMYPTPYLVNPKGIPIPSPTPVPNTSNQTSTVQPILNSTGINSIPFNIPIPSTNTATVNPNNKLNIINPMLSQMMYQMSQIQQGFTPKQQLQGQNQTQQLNQTQPQPTSNSSVNASVPVSASQETKQVQQNPGFDPQLIEDPVNIIHKNLFEKGWFVEVENRRMINMNSHELFEFMEVYYKSGKKADKLTIHDYLTDMYFNPDTLLENLKEVIPQIKSSMAKQFHLSNKNSHNSNTVSSRSSVGNGSVDTSNTGKFGYGYGTKSGQSNPSGNSNKTMNLNVNVNFHNVNNIIIEEDKRKKTKKQRAAVTNK